MLSLSCGSASVKSRPNPNPIPTPSPTVVVPDGIEACIIKGDECEFDSGYRKGVLHKDKIRRATKVGDIQGWISLPPNIFIDLIRQFPEEPSK